MLLQCFSCQLLQRVVLLICAGTSLFSIDGIWRSRSSPVFPEQTVGRWGLCLYCHPEACQQGRIFYPQIYSQSIPILRCWYDEGWDGFLLYSLSYLVCWVTKFQRVVTGEWFCRCWGSLALTENTQIGNHSLELLVQSPRATFPNHHCLPNNKKKINELHIFKTKLLKICLLLFLLKFLWFTYLCDCKHQGIVLLSPTWWISLRSSRLECHLGSLILSPRTCWDCETCFIIKVADSKMLSDPGSSNAVCITKTKINSKQNFQNSESTYERAPDRIVNPL